MEKPLRIDVGSHLFLTAAPNLALGSRLSPGHWRRTVSSWTLARHKLDGSLRLEPDAQMAILELVWETVRLREFPHLPSRLDSLFLWMKEDVARAWEYRKRVLGIGKHINDPVSGLYEVEVEQCHRVFAADMNFISYMEAGETTATLMERARRYWRGERADHKAEVLLEGSVIICRDLLALDIEAFKTVKEPKLDQAIRASIYWAASHEWHLERWKTRYFLQGALVADDRLDRLPMSISGWVGVRLEDRSEPIRSELGMPPVLIRPEERVEIDTTFKDLPQISAGGRYQPVLVCDRSAAHYWQLNPYWEGQLQGEWQVI